MGDNRSAIFADDSNSGRIDEGVAGRQTIGHFEQQRQPSTPSFFSLLRSPTPQPPPAQRPRVSGRYTPRGQRVSSFGWLDFSKHRSRQINITRHRLSFFLGVTHKMQLQIYPSRGKYLIVVGRFTGSRQQRRSR